MYGVHIKNCDRKSILYVPFEISFYSMVSVAVTFLSRLSVFPRKLECFCALFIARIFLKLKKKNKPFPPMAFLQNTYRGYKKFIVVHCIDVNRTVHFPHGVMSEQCRASFAEPTHWNKRPIQRETLGWSQFLRAFMHGHTSL